MVTWGYEADVKKLGVIFFYKPLSILLPWPCFIMVFKLLAIMARQHQLANFKFARNFKNEFLLQSKVINKIFKTL